MSDDVIENAIKQSASGPKSASGDGHSVEQHSLTDQIAADKHLASKSAMASQGLGIKFVKLSPSGTV